MYTVNAADAPGGPRTTTVTSRVKDAFKRARDLFNLHSGPGEVTVTDEFHQVLFRIYRREESETPVELLD